MLFGEQDILINNIAWMLRHLPVVGIFGKGDYRLQPIHVGDLADLAVEQGFRRENVVLNAIGPETFTYRGLVEQLRQIIGRWRPIVSVPPWARLSGEPRAGPARPRRSRHPRRNRRADEQSPLRRFAADRHDEVDRLGHGKRREPRPALRQRVGATVSESVDALCDVTGL